MKNSLKLFMQRKGNLWRYVDEALTQQQTYRLACVAEDLLKLFSYVVRSIFLTLVQNQIFDLLH